MRNPQLTILSKSAATTIWLRIAVYCFTCVLIWDFAQGQESQRQPLEVVKSVADKIIRETVFEFKEVPQKPVLGIEFVDFQRLFGPDADGVAYARSKLISQADATITFGVSSDGPLQIWINGISVFRRSGPGHGKANEIAYNMVEFDGTFEADLEKGSNALLVKSAASPSSWTFFLRATTPTKEHEASVEFESPHSDSQSSSAWLCVGPFQSRQTGDLSKKFPPEDRIAPFYIHENKKYVWTTPTTVMLAELVIPASNTYKRESYIEWHYATGAAMMVMLQLADITGDQRYAQFTQRACDFVLKNAEFFRWQYESLHAFRGSYHRLFRRTMLDDTGAPALGFVELLRRGHDHYWDFVSPIADYILHEQVRLEDGTFCRPEPVSYTVWADDLFMSSPFLLRMGKVSKEPKYFDEVAQQIIRFYELLFDADKGLVKHGWFSPTNNTSVAYWGRANGWMIWAVSEALLHLPREHPQYERILERFRAHMAGLSRYQDSSGMWHQVLDHRESYEETSCTAMFVLGMARGVKNGWLDEEYRRRALRGWDALQNKIEADGTVHGICRGTGIGYDLDFYYTRATFDHDPRGLGAVITAGIEVSRMSTPKKEP